MGRNLLIGAFVSALLLVSCKQQEELTAAKPKGPKKPEVLIEQMQQHEFKCQTISLRASTNVLAPPAQPGQESTNQSFKTAIRMHMDSAIWLSISKLKVEAARVLITPDSIKFINRLEQQYFVGDFEKIDSLFNVEADFDGLQSLILGNSVGIEMPEKQDRKEKKGERREGRTEKKEEKKEDRVEKKELKKGGQKDVLKESRKEERVERKEDRKEHKGTRKKREKPHKIKVSTDGSHFLISTFRKRKLKKTIEKEKAPKNLDVVYSVWLRYDNNKVAQSTVYDLNTLKSFNAFYEDFLQIEGQLIPQKVRLEIRDQQTAEIKLDYTKIVINEPVKLKFRIPKKYEQIF